MYQDVFAVLPLRWGSLLDEPLENLLTFNLILGVALVLPFWPGVLLVSGSLVGIAFTSFDPWVPFIPFSLPGALVVITLTVLGTSDILEVLFLRARVSMA